MLFLPKGERKQKKKLEVLPAVVGTLPVLNWLSTNDIRNFVGQYVIVDIEVYPNFFFVGFQHVETGKVECVELSPAVPVLDVKKLTLLLWTFCCVTFNGNNYDFPLLNYIIAKGPSITNEDIFEASKAIILEELQPYQFYKQYKVKPANFNHIDLIEVAPLNGSLKLYAARQNARKLQELPYDPLKPLTEEQAYYTRFYCFNDTGNTRGLFLELKPNIDLRIDMGKQYDNKDFRSRSDAQLAEEIVLTELTKVLGERPQKPGSKVGLTFKYKAPDFIKFSSPSLQSLLADIEALDLVVGESGHVILPDAIADRKIEINGKPYKVGLGGLHSNEQVQALHRTADTIIVDRDVTGYYPNLILKNGFFPEHLGPAFLVAFQNIVDKRYTAKKAGDDKTANILKIASNGTFGKLSDPFSFLYDPRMMVATTFTGQLCLLMAIEWLESEGFAVMSANTDGIVIACPVGKYGLLNEIFAYWEKVTKLETEETQYAFLYSRDVNNYIAGKLKFDKQTKTWLEELDTKPKSRFADERLGCKTKGTYSERGSAQNSILSKNPEHFICTDAVLEMLVNKTPVEQTILNCKDITRFVSIKNVKGGGHQNGRYLGKIVRWYYCTDKSLSINYVTGNNQVAKSEGARPLMELPDELPSDIDYAWYIEQANKMLWQIGFVPKPLDQQKLFF